MTPERYPFEPDHVIRMLRSAQSSLSAAIETGDPSAANLANRQAGIILRWLAEGTGETDKAASLKLHAMCGCGHSPEERLAFISQLLESCQP